MHKEGITTVGHRSSIDLTDDATPWDGMLKPGALLCGAQSMSLAIEEAKHNVSFRVFLADCPFHSLGSGAVPSYTLNFTRVWLASGMAIGCR
ncbi:hypothetical protein TNCV_1440331 [Trichonephila clavipes]|nr:hypothetical protein TNCV_1440331 [Trichonephila clavipes]